MVACADSRTERAFVVVGMEDGAVSGLLLES